MKQCKFGDVENVTCTTNCWVKDQD